MILLGSRPDPHHDDDPQTEYADRHMRKRATPSTKRACGCPSDQCLDAGSLGCYFGEADFEAMHEMRQWIRGGF